MSALIPFLALDQIGDQVLAFVNQQLTGAGFRVVQTFDLQVARLTHADCICPHHGTARCNCQMIVLLVYGEHPDPATLVIHGQDAKTWLSLASPLQHSDRHFESAIRRVLMPRQMVVPSSLEVTHETQSTA